MQYNAIIVDDEQHPRDLLNAILKEKYPFVNISATCNGPDQALEAIQTHSPEIVFLDVEMPGKSGFEMLASLPAIHFDIIFTTSYSKYALQAIKFSALDYLLKPIDETQLGLALDKFREKRSLTETTIRIENLLQNLQTAEQSNQKIALPTSNGYLFVRVSDIVRCESQNTYTTFFLSDKNQIVVSRTLKDCEEMLGEYRFQRIHQSHLINMSFLKRYIKGDGGEVIMEDGTRLDVSRRKKEDFLEAIGK